MADTDDAPDNTEKLLADARKAYEAAREYEDESWREEGLADLKFARMADDEQWPDSAKDSRGHDRPMLTLNKLGPVIRQVVNDARQNKPQITVRPAGGDADKDTSDILSGLIRNIEYVSDADVAYDTAVENAVTCGVGYFRVNTRYTSDDTFDQDLAIERIGNSFSVYGDPHGEKGDSSDWEQCFVTSWISKSEFEREYKDADKVDWDTEYGGLDENWVSENKVMVAEWWQRSKYYKTVLMLDSGVTVTKEEYEDQPELFAQNQIIEERQIECWKVTLRNITGADILETNDWQGQYIPIIPVYGDEINVEGKRYFRALIHDAKDAQRMYNYWRSTVTEMVALSPRAPYIGEEGAFDFDPNWSRANDPSISYLEYSAGKPAPQRQFFDGTPMGAMNEALSASDDIKAITGIHDASLGKRSNETSGVAIRARQMEGDTSTFHFLDNLTRAIRHGGRVLLDLIPKVYNADRILRILGADMQPQTAIVSTDPQAKQQEQIRQAAEKAQNEQQLQELLAKLPRIYDITAGKYDLVVKAGPSYTTQREETRAELVEIIRSSPPEFARPIAKLYLKNSDWPGSEELLEEIEGQMPSPEQIQEGQQRLQELEAENAELKAEQWLKSEELRLKGEELQLEAAKLPIEKIKAEAELTKAQYSGQQTYPLGQPAA